MHRAAFLLVILVGCEPDYSNTAFRCDDEHGCPDEQTCVHGRCRRGGAVGRVNCEGTLCAETEQCCWRGAANGASCIPAGEICEGESALCDSLDDCQSGDQCCAGETAACGDACPEDEVMCTTNADCPPGTEPFCCSVGSTPWMKCNRTSC